MNATEGGNVRVAALDGGPRISAALAALLGWVGVALDNARVILTEPQRPGAVDVRFLHLAFDLGQTLAFGLVAWAAVALVVEWRRVSALRAFAALALTSAVVFERVLTDDLSNFTDRLFHAHADLVLPLLCAALGMTIPAAALASRLPPRPLVRLPFAAAGLGLIALNDYVLVNDYHGGHLWIAATGATLLGASLAGLVLSGAPARFALAITPWRARGALAVVAAGVAASIALPPPSAVKSHLMGRDTAFLARSLAPLHPPPKSVQATVPRELKAAFKARAKRGEVHATSRGVLGHGAIVVLLTVDALRADVFSEKYAADLPNLQEFRRSAVFFSEARSFSSSTRFSMAGLLTGRYLSMLKTTKERSNGKASYRFDKLLRVQEVLGKYGVKSVHASPLPLVFNEDVGLARGFTDQFLFSDGEKRQGTPEVMAHAFETLKKQGPEPLFYAMHIIDPHLPYYDHGKPTRGPHDAYMHEVAYVDEWIGGLRKKIRELGIAHRTMLILSSDHGEGFGEHGLHTHNKALYEVQVRVPLLIECPGVAPRTDDTYVSLLDVPPTILDTFGVPTPGYFMGDSLVPLLEGGKLSQARIVYMERPYTRALLFPDGIKVILTDRPLNEEVYDLRTDPEEETNLRDEEIGMQRTALAWKYFKTHRWKRGEPPKGSQPAAAL